MSVYSSGLALSLCLCFLVAGGRLFDVSVVVWFLILVENRKDGVQQSQAVDLLSVVITVVM